MTGEDAAAAALPRGSIGVAAFSTVVEWYDFTLYLYFATVLSRIFYGGGENALLTALAGFALSYLLRPIGAIVWGHIGDRYGRRSTMLGSMALMTAAMLATAALPTAAAIGPLAGWLLIALRCVMAFSVGGEYTGVVAYLLEGARPDRRGLVTSLASGASEVGGLLAVGVSAATVALLPAADVEAWGWRVPFLVGAALAGGVLVARTTMLETPEFERQRIAGTVPRHPLRYALAHHRRGIARGFAISALGSITYYVGIAYAPAFLASAGRLDESRALGLSVVAALAVIAVTPLTGALSDRIGRRPVLLALAGAAVVLPLAAFPLMATGAAAPALAGALLLACLGGAVSAVGAVATAEQFGGEGRLTGLAFGATTATAIFGGLAPLVAQWLIERTGLAVAPGLMIAAVGLGVMPVLLALRETAPTRPRAIAGHA